MQLDKNLTYNGIALKTIIEDIGVNKNSVINFSPVQLQFR